MAELAVIIVTHNSQDVLPRCLDALSRQTIQADIVLVDSGSKDVSYLDAYRMRSGIRVILEENIGFSRANNRGCQALSQAAEFILFLNPDAFLTESTLQKALVFLKENKKVGCVGGRLLGCDKNSGLPTNLLDSTGVFRKWYGCWHDRSQGETEKGQYPMQEDVPALCGAFLFCRQAMLSQLSLDRSTSSTAVFDPDFFLYKEDIELCLRIRKAGWRIVYHPGIKVYHCRGWQKERKQTPHNSVDSGKSELLLYKKHPSLYIVWALFKYLLVRLLKI